MGNIPRHQRPRQVRPWEGGTDYAPHDHISVCLSATPSAVSHLCEAYKQLYLLHASARLCMCPMVELGKRKGQAGCLV